MEKFMSVADQTSATTLDLIHQRILDSKKLPIEVLFDRMDDMIASDQLSAAAGIASMIAPYVHAKIRDVVIKGDQAAPVLIQQQQLRESFRNLSDKELDDLERLMMKGVGTEVVQKAIEGEIIDQESDD